MYARIESGACTAYPVDLRAEHPHTSFPWDWAGGVIEGVEYARVTPVDVPQVPHTQNFIEGSPTLIDGVWTQTWIVTEATPEQIAEREADARRRMVISPLQARRAIRAAGMMPAVEAALALADDDTREVWEYAIEVRRDDPVLAAMAAKLSLTAEQLDALFRSALAY